MERLARWLWWATIGRTIDLACVSLTLAFLPLWYFILRPRGWGNPYVEPKPTMTVEELIALGPKDPVRDGYYSDVEDYHGLMCQVGQGYFGGNSTTADHLLFKWIILQDALTKNSSLYRYVPSGRKPSNSPPSVDMLAAWIYTYTVIGFISTYLLKRLTDTFIQNTFTLRDLQGRVSPRCTTGGVTFSSHPETFLRLTKPALGQEAVVASALLALAKKELGGFKYAFFYYLHYFGHFVWFWRLFSWLPFKLGTSDKTDFTYNYVGHVCAMAHYCLHKTGIPNSFGFNWIVRVCQPRAGIQPFLAAMAADCGLLTIEEKQRALKWLLYSHPTWPQMFNVTEPDPNQKTFSMPALAAVQLTKERE